MISEPKKKPAAKKRPAKKDSDSEISADEFKPKKSKPAKVLENVFSISQLFRSLLHFV